MLQVLGFLDVIKSYVSLLFPAWLQSSAFTDVGLKVLVSYWYHSYGAQFLCWRLTFRETAKALPTREGMGGQVC